MSSVMNDNAKNKSSSAESSASDASDGEINVVDIQDDKASEDVKKDDKDDRDDDVNKISSEKGKSQDDDPNVKPRYSYIALITMAIVASPKQKCTLSEICEFIRDKFAYYRHKDPKWESSIRHNLSLNDCFIKERRPLGMAGKGCLWKVDSRSKNMFKGGTFRRRRNIFVSKNRDDNSVSKNSAPRQSHSSTAPYKVPSGTGTSSTAQPYSGSHPLPLNILSLAPSSIALPSAHPNPYYGYFPGSLSQTYFPRMPLVPLYGAAMQPQLPHERWASPYFADYQTPMFSHSHFSSSAFSHWPYYAPSTTGQAQAAVPGQPSISSSLQTADGSAAPPNGYFHPQI